VVNVGDSKNCTRTLVVLTANNEFAVAAVRKALYVWDAQTGSLVTPGDAAEKLLWPSHVK